MCVRGLHVVGLDYLQPDVQTHGINRSRVGQLMFSFVGRAGRLQNFMRAFRKSTKTRQTDKNNLPIRHVLCSSYPNNLAPPIPNQVLDENPRQRGPKSEDWLNWLSHPEDFLSIGTIANLSASLLDQLCFCGRCTRGQRRRG